MDHLCPGVGQLDRVEIRQFGNQHRVREQPGVGAQDAVDVLPDRYAPGIEQIAGHGGRVVRSFAAERRRAARRRRADESLSDQYAFGGCVDGPAQSSSRPVDVDGRLAVAAVGHEKPAHVEPPVRRALCGEVFRDDDGREQFAVAYDPVVPAIVILPAGFAAKQFPNLRGEFFGACLDGRGIGEQRADDLPMVSFDLREPFDRFVRAVAHEPVEHFLQRIGRLAHSRDDNQ